MTKRWARARSRDAARRLIDRYYRQRGWVSAYRRYEQTLSDLLEEDSAVLDVGCGHDFPMAPFLCARCSDIHGVDVGAFDASLPDGATLTVARAERLPFAEGSFDVVTSRSVLEHLQEPMRVFAEFCRVLRPGGHIVFLTANRYDYVSLAARMLPNSWHPRIIRIIEGRDESDTFPTHYHANSVGQIQRISRAVGLAVVQVRYVNHFPYMLTFSALLCRLGILYDQIVTRCRCLNWLQAWVLGVLQKPVRRQGA